MGNNNVLECLKRRISAVDLLGEWMKRVASRIAQKSVYVFLCVSLYVCKNCFTYCCRILHIINIETGRSACL